MDDKIENHLKGIDPDRREFIKTLAGRAFVVPVVASFSLSGSVMPALAIANTTYS